MIGIIGIKKVIVLLILVGLNIGLASIINFYGYPEKSRTDSSLINLRAEISSVQADIDRIQIEFEQLDKQQKQFDALKASGFFSNQLRSVAKNKFKEIQTETNVISAVASVMPGKIEGNEEADKAKHKLIVSRIAIDIRAFDDLDVYRYVDKVQKSFPGMVSLEKLTMVRTKDVNGPVLRAIAAGEYPELIKASVELNWRTMVPEDQISAEDNEENKL